MTIERLMRVVPPPEAPFEPFAGPWEPVEAYLGTELPHDYKDLVLFYGRGRFQELLYVNLPGSPDRRGTLQGELDLAREMVNYGVPVPYPAWPEPGGLLNVGLTEFNDRLFWLTRGEPSEWRIVAWDRAYQKLETFDCDLTDFLAGLATGEIAPEGFAGRTLPAKPVFDASQSAPGLASPEGAGIVSIARTAGRGIEALTRIVPPPLKPFRAFSGPWGPVEAYLGTALPQDYKDFVRIYGSGLLLDLLTVHVPGIKNPHVNLAVQVREAPRYFMPDEELPYRLWPRLDGLIKFGGTDNGDHLYWLPRGPPDDWKVVFWDGGRAEPDPFQEFDCGLAEFLAGLASGAIVPKGYGEEHLEPHEPMFHPYADKSEPSLPSVRHGRARPGHPTGSG